MDAPHANKAASVAPELEADVGDEVGAQQDGGAAGQCRRHLAVNDTLYARLRTLTLLGVHTASRRMAVGSSRSPHVGHAYPLSEHTVVKTGGDVRLDEAATMRFVAERTSIPVPKVLHAFVHNGASFIVMEKIRGKELAKIWHQLSDDTRASLLGQLRQMLEELRALPPPTGFAVGSCVGGSLQDFRQRQAPPPVQFGPFKTIQGFHRWLRDDLELGQANSMDQVDRDDLDAMITRQDGSWPQPVFTHGDLNPSNILVRDERIVGIIDWEMSGWYPHYWEYTSLRLASYIVNPAWDESIEKFLHPFPDELKMERTRFRWWGNIA
ncbi:hypothetical protein Daus18300_012951 [Diaporthe australafricana]|uniref:Aminoglycoside phosphotransferase domain-containing protein n=1 Tax=Diaporthe australafricana TaxID=127596 RepID=A0ABR3W0W9_9PEZI